MRFGAMAPIDTLHSSNINKKSKSLLKGEIASKRYKEYRKDPKIVESLNTISSKEFLCMPGAISSNVIRTRLIIPGYIELICTGTKQILSDIFPSKCLLTFIQDNNGPRCEVTHKSLLVNGLQFQLSDECQQVLFEDRNSCIGFRFKNSRSLKLSNDRAIELESFIWCSNPANESKISKVKRLLVTTTGTGKLVRIFGTKTELKNKLSANSSIKSNADVPFWEKGFKSLETQKKSLLNPGAKLVSSSKRILIQREIQHNNAIDITIQERDATEMDYLVRIPSHRQTRSKSKLFDEIIDKDSTDDDFKNPVPFSPSLYYHFNDKTSYTITNQDFKSLYNNDWVNDTIIDFFIKYYMEFNVPLERRNEIHILSSFFYTKLTSKTQNEFYDNVKKWVEHAELFSKKYVVIPINNNFHWFACIIINLREFHDYLKSHTDIENIAEMPVIQILTFDSLKQSHNKEIDPIKEFLISYASDRYSIIIDKNSIKLKTCPVPRQPNFSDCGVHVILNTQIFFQNPSKTIEFWNSLKSRNNSSFKAVNEYFNRKEREGSRKKLRELLIALKNKQSIKTANSKSIDVYAHGEDDDSDIEIIEDINEYRRMQEEKQANNSDASSTPDDINNLPGS